MSINEELHALYNQDQADRKNGLHPDLRERDEMRRQRVSELIASGALHSPEVYGSPEL